MISVWLMLLGIEVMSKNFEEGLDHEPGDPLAEVEYPDGVVLGQYVRGWCQDEPVAVEHVTVHLGEALLDQD